MKHLRNDCVFNPRRKIDKEVSPKEKKRLSEIVRYGGNPEHKRNPGDFGLTPPCTPRPDKTLCDGVQIFERKIAESLLREGARRGLISVQKRKSFPQNIWAVTLGGQALEAQLENAKLGTYHGYPMQTSDPLCRYVLDLWNIDE